MTVVGVQRDLDLEFAIRTPEQLHELRVDAQTVRRISEEVMCGFGWRHRLGWR